MKTIRIKIYEFNELNENAKQNAIEWYRNQCLDHDFVYDDMHKTVEEFNDLFGTKEGYNSWLDFSTSNIEDSVLNLKGFRLQKYIWNNYGYKLFKGKYCGSLNSNNVFYHARIRSKVYKNGNVYNPYYSGITKDTSYTLTGMCYDDDMLKPIYDFLNSRNPEGTTFEDLLNECFYAAKKTIENEVEYRNTDEFIIEEIEANEHEFTKEGNKF